MKRKILLLWSLLFTSYVYGRQIEVEITNFSFSPVLVTINVGDTIKWVNRDGAAHTVTADGGSFASGTLSTNASFVKKFTGAGTFDYHCAFHPDMTGRITVLASTTDVALLEQPKDFVLYQNYPNPFNPTTKIPVYLSKTTNIRLIVYSVIGKEVQSRKVDYLSEGYHEISFDGSNLSSGIYFYQVRAGENAELIGNRRMILAK